MSSRTIIWLEREIENQYEQFVVYSEDGSFNFEPKKSIANYDSPPNMLQGQFMEYLFHDPVETAFDDALIDDVLDHIVGNYDQNKDYAHVLCIKSDEAYFPFSNIPTRFEYQSEAGLVDLLDEAGFQTGIELPPGSILISYQATRGMPY